MLGAEGSTFYDDLCEQSVKIEVYSIRVVVNLYLREIPEHSG